MISKIIALALGLMVVAIVAPIALGSLADVSQTTTHESYTEVLGMGDGETLIFEGTLDHYPIDTGTCTVTATVSETPVESTGDADELVLDEDTGVYTLTYVTNGPDDGTSITAVYDYTTTIDDASFTLLTVLLPIIAVIGMVLFFLGKMKN